jgi:hypothetical protein
MNATPITPTPNTVIRVVLFPAPPVNKAARRVVEETCVAEVRRAVNAWTYGG